MPRYRWLGTTMLRRDDLGRHLSALRRVGVPYSDDMIANASMDAYGQAVPDSAEAVGVVRRYGTATNVRTFDGQAAELTEMDALVAYLQVLGSLTDAASRTMAEAKQP
jgi:cytochrome c oxidase cbb3-type subunit 2